MTRAFREPLFKRLPRQSRTLARAIRAGRARASAADPPREVDAVRLRGMLAEVAAETLLVDVPVDRAPWTEIPLQVRAGESITWLGWGAVPLLKPLGIVLTPALALRVRVQGGTPQSSPDDTGTFVAEADGPLEVGSAYPGEMDEHGAVTLDRLPYRVMRGRLTAVLVRWPPGTDVRQVLTEIAERDVSGLCAMEAARLAEPPRAPEGWNDHPLLPICDVFSPTDGGMAARARGVVSIIRRPVTVLLTPQLRLRWRWRVEALPSRLPEDTLLTHDYLSVALEFDDGRDLTWQWSAALAPGYSYRCPLEHWRHRETHIVVRSGTQDLGRWLAEDRAVLADHQVAVGGAAPARVVGVWLIAVTVFQGLEGRAEFRDIELTDGHTTIEVM